MEANIQRIQRDIEAINDFNATPGEGVTRLSFSHEYKGAIDYVIEALKKIGADVSVRMAGNLQGRLEGSEKGAPSVMVGSHIDTVIHGGRFDGVAGVVSALEVARVIVENGISHRHPVDAVIFAEEEGSRFGSVLVGSRSWVGKLSLDGLGALKDRTGLSYTDAMKEGGITPVDSSVLKSDQVKAMLELHIEQSVVLDNKGLQIGVVEAIAGIKQFLVTVSGVPNHAGATPMNYRFDAMQGAARIISAVEEIARGTSEKSVATVGFVNCEPGLANVIPGRAEFTLDLRDPEAGALHLMERSVREAIERTCRERELTYHVGQRSDTPPIALSGEVITLVEKVARERGVETLRMVSGALHDSSIMAELTKVGMVFVPSKEGRSHCLEEFTDLKDIKTGTDILLASVIELAK